MEIQKGILVVISGFSGSGKGTVMKELLKRYPSDYALSVSATTRLPRDGEVEGREYFFKSVEQFEKMIANDELIEYAKYVSNYYGTPKAYVEEQLSEGRNVILEIETQGALNIKRKFTGTPLIFLTPPDAQTLYDRLVNRGSEPMEVIASRLRRAVEEAELVDQYDYRIVNDDLDQCVEEVHGLIQSVRDRVFANRKFAEHIKADLLQILKGER
jgi:guanylate kinase